MEWAGPLPEDSNTFPKAPVILVKSLAQYPVDSTRRRGPCITGQLMAVGRNGKIYQSLFECTDHFRTARRVDEWIGEVT